MLADDTASERSGHPLLRTRTMSDAIEPSSPLQFMKSQDTQTTFGEDNEERRRLALESSQDGDERPRMSRRLSTKDNLRRLLSLKRKEARAKAQPLPPQPTDNSTPPNLTLWDAAKSGDAAALQYHLTASPTPSILVNSRDPDADFTLLHAVVSHVRDPTAAMHVLLDHGADVSARNMYNVQAIHIVPLTSSEPLNPLRLLLQCGADVNARDGDGWTPLHYTARFCPVPLPPMRMLVAQGAAIDARDTAGKTPLFCLLANRDDPDAVTWMVERRADAGAEADFLDKRSGATTRGTVLLQAVKYQRIGSLRVLVERAPECLKQGTVEQAVALVQRQRKAAKVETAGPGPNLLGNGEVVGEETVKEMEKVLREVNERVGEGRVKRPSLLRSLSSKLARKAQMVLHGIA
ncbi:ankyrin repeat-containing domain protein [Jimgerdemannia flammicorona]|uniref:Ankyrin repeat-containing domain protein n=1 Tax=Jimgerdemannia flammicorona TaxID=994334 RepID=A0A433D8Z9_9FUNG|nr:ankyrin repeat-containing domain protein [Jimgerdemannia flammicorona]